MHPPPTSRRVTCFLAVCGLVLSSPLFAGTGVEAWVRQYGGLASAPDRLTGLVVDGNGNVIVTGHTDLAGNYIRDVATVKYSGDGTKLWTNRFEPFGDTYSEARGVAVNRITGVCYIAGRSIRGGSDYSSFVMACSGGGSPLWTNRVSHDATRAIAVDEVSGNIYGTGSGNGLNDAKDFVTVAWSGAGVALWTNRYDGPSEDSAVAVAVDAVRGRVFVTGASAGTNSNWDIATVAYSSAGVALWTNRFNGPSNYVDSASAVAVDETSGNVYVFGAALAGSFNGEFVTIAYSSVGVPLWTNRFNDPMNGVVASALAVDAQSGNVYVTGSSYNSMVTGYDFATVAYTRAGVALWTNLFDDPINNDDDVARAVTVDPTNGQVYVAGFCVNDTTVKDCVTIAYSALGTPLWTNRHAVSASDGSEPLKLGVDSSTGRVFAGFRTSNYVTLAWSAAGVPLWTNLYDGLKGILDVSQTLALNRSNRNVYVAGYTRSNPLDQYGYDCLIIAYSNTGTVLWINRYDGPAGMNDQAQAVAVDETSGRVYVAGSATFSGLYADFTVLTYSGAGVLLRTNRYNGRANLNDAATAIVVDSLSGRVYATGFSTGTNTSSDYTTIAWSNIGTPLWTNRYDPGYSRSDAAQAMVVNESNGNIYVTGISESSSAVDEIATVAYSAAGAPLWTNRYSGPYFGDDAAQAIAVNRSNGNVYAVGYVATTFASYDCVTLAYSSNGVPLWTNLFNYDPSPFYDGSDLGRAVAVDSGNGNIYVAGQFELRSAGVTMIGVLAYSSTGECLWTNQYSIAGDIRGQARAVALDEAGHVYVTGYSGSGTNYDIVTLVYSSAGVALATNRYNGPGDKSDTIESHKSLAVSPEGIAHVAGGTVTINQDPDLATIKYAYGPEITLQPAPRTNGVGTTATFNVAAIGMTPLAFRWERNGVPLSNGETVSGADGTLLSLSKLWFTDAGDYSVIVSNSIGTTVSLPAALTVTGVHPRFTRLEQLENGTVRINGSAAVNAHLRIETSTNLVDWQLLVNFTNQSTFTVDDGEAVIQPWRFYRAVWLP